MRQKWRRGVSGQFPGIVNGIVEFIFYLAMSRQNHAKEHAD